MLHVDAEGKVRTVARRDLGFDLPRAYTMRAWWLSPVLRELVLAAQDLLATPDPLAAGERPRPPVHIALLAAVLCVLSLLGAVLLSGRQQHPPARRLAWVLACGVIGLPALASLWLLYPAGDGDAR